jgi:eukaryotic-like serine/threonine-protein kinase
MLSHDSLRAALAGRYTLERELGAGGMATVYLAQDLRHERKVALKLLREELSASLGKERFLREIKVAAALQHPHILPLYDSGAADNLLYYVMPYVDGPSLRDKLAKEGELPIGEAVRILRDVADALTEAHRHGVVHRDLKPENIMVDDEDNIKLIDFGIASKSGSRRLTFAKLSQVMGTPDYISPEQVKGKRGDARSDIYAMGVMLYEMLTGKTPFTGPNAFAIMNDRLLNNPVPPREVNPEITPQLQEVIYRAMERDPKSRYASAREFGWDLAHLDQVGVAERAELRDWKQRRSPWLRRILFYLMLAVIPIAVFGLLLYVAKHT